MKVKLLHSVLFVAVLFLSSFASAQSLRGVEVPSDKVMMFGSDKNKNQAAVINNDQNKAENPANKEKIHWRKKVDPNLYDMPQNYKVPHIIKR
jgi:hypothetical protein